MVPAAPPRPPAGAHGPPQAELTKAGYLQKKGQLLKGWKRRWFVLDASTLSYYKDENEKKPHAAIPLDACTVLDGGHSETWNSPRIYVSDGTTGTMYCLSHEERDEILDWFRVLRAAIARRASMSDASLAGMTMSDAPVAAPTPVPTPTAAGAAAAGADVGGEPEAVWTNTRRRRFKSEKRQSKMIASNEQVEINLARGFQAMDALVKDAEAWQLVSATDGMRVSAHNASAAARGTVLLNAPPDVAAQLLLDLSKRREWDVHFPRGSTLAQFGPLTDVVHLQGSLQWTEQPRSAVSTAAGACLGGLLSLAAGGDVRAGVAAGLVLGAGPLTPQWSRACKPRDMVLVRHARENPDGSYTIVERSIEHEGAPVQRSAVRATTQCSGFHVQPLFNEDCDRSIVTQISDLDLGGWVPAGASAAFQVERLRCLPLLREYVVQLPQMSEKPEAPDGQDDEGAEETKQEEGQQHEAEGFAGPMTTLDDWMAGLARVPTGGLKCTDREVIRKQKGVLREVLRNFGATILEGKSAVSLSLPVRIFEPRSMLQRVCDAWVYAPEYLGRAAASEDPVLRLKCAAATVIAGLHHCCGQLKPFNPILGETYQTALVAPDGSQTTIVAEQSSHHPPIALFTARAPDGAWTLYGAYTFTGSFKGNAVTSMQTGPCRIVFRGGHTITFSMPYVRMGGFLWGDRVVEWLGEINFVDEQNGLRCEVKLNPDAKGWFGGGKASDSLRGDILDRSGNPVCQATGSWLDFLEFDGERIWDIEEHHPARFAPRPAKLLRSDCRFREDLAALAAGDLDLAQSEKVRLEKLQRADRALRKAERERLAGRG